MGMVLLIVGALVATVPFMFTGVVNGAALLGVMIMLAGVWKVAQA